MYENNQEQSNLSINEYTSLAEIQSGSYSTRINNMSGSMRYFKLEGFQKYQRITRSLILGGVEIEDNITDESLSDKLSSADQDTYTRMVSGMYKFIMDHYACPPYEQQLESGRNSDIILDGVHIEVTTPGNKSEASELRNKSEHYYGEKSLLWILTRENIADHLHRLGYPRTSCVVRYTKMSRKGNTLFSCNRSKQEKLTHDLTQYVETNFNKISGTFRSVIYPDSDDEDEYQEIFDSTSEDSIVKELVESMQLSDGMLDYLDLNLGSQKELLKNYMDSIDSGISVDHNSMFQFLIPIGDLKLPNNYYLKIGKSRSTRKDTVDGKVNLYRSLTRIIALIDCLLDVTGLKGKLLWRRRDRVGKVKIDKVYSSTLISKGFSEDDINANKEYLKVSEEDDVTRELDIFMKINKCKISRRAGIYVNMTSDLIDTLRIKYRSRKIDEEYNILKGKGQQKFLNINSIDNIPVSSLEEGGFKVYLNREMKGSQFSKDLEESYPENQYVYKKETLPRINPLKYEGHKAFDNGVINYYKSLSKCYPQLSEFFEGINLELPLWSDPVLKKYSQLFKLEDFFKLEENSILISEYMVMSRLAETLVEKGEEQKNGSGDIFHRESIRPNLDMYYTENTNEDQTGLVWFVYHSQRVNQLFEPKYIGLNDDNTLRMTIPVRLNGQYVKQIMEHLLNTLATRVMEYIMSDKCQTLSPFMLMLQSLYKRHYRRFADIDKQIMSLLISTACLGKKDIISKFLKLRYDNCLVPYALTRIRDNFNRETDIYHENLMGDKMSIEGMTDIITNIPYHNNQNFQLMCSKTTLLIRSDGRSYSAYELDNMVNEAEFEKEFRESSFMDKGETKYHNIQILTWLNSLYPSKGYISEYSFNRKIIMGYVKMLERKSSHKDTVRLISERDNIARAKASGLQMLVDEDEENVINKMRLVKVIEKLARQENSAIQFYLSKSGNTDSKAVIAKALAMFARDKNLDKMTSKIKIKLEKFIDLRQDLLKVKDNSTEDNIALCKKYKIYKNFGLISGKNNTVIYQNEIKYKNILKDNLPSMIEKGDVEEYITATDIDEINLTTKVAMLIATFISECKSILTTAVKITEANSDKRNYFVQHPTPHGVNQVVENSLFPLLLDVYSNIQEGGNSKSIGLEEIAKKYSKFLTTAFDMTKFGDKIVLEAMLEFIRAAYHANLIDLELADWMTFAIDNIRNRIIIMPPSVTALLDKYKRLTEMDSESIDANLKEYLRLKYTLVEDKMAKLRKLKEEIDFQRSNAGTHVFSDTILENQFLRSSRGFVLGVFNIFGTLMSMGTCLIEEAVYMWLGLNKDFCTSIAQSDDKLSFYKLRANSKYVYNREVYKDFRSKLKKNCFIQNGDLIYWRGTTDIVDNDLLFTYTVELSVLLVRCFGLRYGGLKSKIGLREMLQSVYLNNSWAPALSKFTYSISKNIREGDLGRSLLESATGGISSLRVNGAEGSVLESLIVFLQLMVYYIHGIKPKKDILTTLPINGGVYFAQYNELIKYGFRSYHGFILNNCIANREYRRSFNMFVLNNEIYNLSRMYRDHVEEEEVDVINHFIKLEVPQQTDIVNVSVIDSMMTEFCKQTLARIDKIFQSNVQRKYTQINNYIVEMKNKLLYIEECNQMERDIKYRYKMLLEDIHTKERISGSDLKIDRANALESVNKEIHDNRSEKYSEFLSINSSVQLLALLNIADFGKRYSIIKASLKRPKTTNQSRTLRVMRSIESWMINNPFSDETIENIRKLLPDFANIVSNKILLWSDIMYIINSMINDHRFYVTDKMGLFLSIYQNEVQSGKRKYVMIDFDKDAELDKPRKGDFTWVRQFFTDKKIVNTQLITVSYLENAKNLEEFIIEKFPKYKFSVQDTIQKIEDTKKFLYTVGINNPTSLSKNIRFVEKLIKENRKSEIIRLPCSNNNYSFLSNYTSSIIPYIPQGEIDGIMVREENIYREKSQLDISSVYNIITIANAISRFSNEIDEDEEKYIEKISYMHQRRWRRSNINKGFTYEDDYNADIKVTDRLSKNTTTLGESMKLVETIPGLGINSAYNWYLKTLINRKYIDFKIYMNLVRPNGDTLRNRITHITVIRDEYSIVIKNLGTIRQKISRFQQGSLGNKLKINIVKWSNTIININMIMHETIALLRVFGFNSDVKLMLFCSSEEISENQLSKSNKNRRFRKDMDKMISRVSGNPYEYRSWREIKEYLTDIKGVGKMWLFRSLQNIEPEITESTFPLLSSAKQDEILSKFKSILREVTTNITNSEYFLNKYDVAMANNKFYENTNNKWRITITESASTQINSEGDFRSGLIFFKHVKDAIDNYRSKDKCIIEPGFYPTMIIDHRTKNTFKLIPWGTEKDVGVFDVELDNKITITIPGNNPTVVPYLSRYPQGYTLLSDFFNHKIEIKWKNTSRINLHFTIARICDILLTPLDDVFTNIKAVSDSIDNMECNCTHINYSLSIALYNLPGVTLFKKIELSKEFYKSVTKGTFNTISSLDNLIKGLLAEFRNKVNRIENINNLMEDIRIEIKTYNLRLDTSNKMLKNMESRNRSAIVKSDKSIKLEGNIEKTINTIVSLEGRLNHLQKEKDSVNDQLDDLENRRQIAIQKVKIAEDSKEVIDQGYKKIISEGSFKSKQLILGKIFSIPNEGDIKEVLNNYDYRESTDTEIMTVSTLKALVYNCVPGEFDILNKVMECENKVSNPIHYGRVKENCNTNTIELMNFYMPEITQYLIINQIRHDCNVFNIKEDDKASRRLSDSLAKKRINTIDSTISHNIKLSKENKNIRSLFEYLEYRNAKEDIIISNSEEDDNDDYDIEDFVESELLDN